MSSLWNQITDFENLWNAYRKAARGKRGRTSVAVFDYQVSDHLLALQEELLAFTYQHGAYRHFYIREPKRRKISASPFRDRVVHHALCNVIEPIFDQRFIPHSYANRVGKGTHRAIEQLQQFAQNFRYVLRADIVRHFPSLDHQILYDQLAKVIKDEAVLWLIRGILRSGEGVLAEEYPMHYFEGDDLFAVARPRGLPIGNLTSQFWSNCYMNGFDWFVVRELGCQAYIRYVDDFALFSDNKTELYEWKNGISARLSALRLTLHERETQVHTTKDGISWLGFVVFPYHRLLKKRNAVSFTRRLTENISRYQSGIISFAELDAPVQGWIAHVSYGDTWGLRTHIFDTHPLTKP